MKKLILSVSMVLMSLNGYPQSSTLNNNPGSFDSSNNPSGVGFSGAMGGANNTPSPSQGTTTTPGSILTPAPGSATGTSTVPSTTLPQERQEEFGNFAGGTMGGQTEDERRLPSNSTVAPTRPNIPAATGVGTGAPTSY